MANPLQRTDSMHLHSYDGAWCMWARRAAGTGFRLVFPVLLICAAGCVSMRDATGPPTGASYRNHDGPTDESAASQEVESARRRIDAGDYSTVLPKLQHVISRYPNTRAAIDARYFTGVAYYRISGYPDALRFFNEYLAMAPEGEYAEASTEYIRLLNDEIARRYIAPEDAAARVAAAKAKVTAEPDVLAHRLELADAHWIAGEYDKAGAVYEDVLMRWPDLANDVTIRDRMRREANGSFTILSPGEVLRQTAQEEPLVIINTATFRSGRETLLARSFQDIYYHVSGQALNRSDQPLFGVQVTVTIYGFGNLVYETQTLNIGTLQPNQVRPFSVRFSEFDSIHNISRYECIGSYSR